MTWCWHFPHQHGTGAADGEGIRPETNTGNGWEAMKWVSSWWEESWGGGQWFKSRSGPKSPSLGVWLFLVQSVTVPVRNGLDIEQSMKKIMCVQKDCLELLFVYGYVPSRALKKIESLSLSVTVQCTANAPAVVFSSAEYQLQNGPTPSFGDAIRYWVRWKHR